MQRRVLTLQVAMLPLQAETARGDEKRFPSLVHGRIIFAFAFYLPRAFMKRGTCKLCRSEEDLLDCHLISAAVSKLLRARQNPNPNPLVVTPDWIGQTSEQVSAHEFCRKCEDIFNERGEQWVLPRLASLDGFPLHDMLLKAQPFFRREELSAYHASDIPDFDKAKIVHFAMAIFWKASVRDWGTKVRRSISILVTTRNLYASSS